MTVKQTIKLYTSRSDTIHIQVDVTKAYLEAQTSCQIYINLPTDITNGEKVTVKLGKNLYGLKDAGLQWYLHIDQLLGKMGLWRSKFDPCCYLGEGVMIVLYVDDFCIFAKTRARMDEILEQLKGSVTSITSKDRLTKFLGVNLTHEESTNVMSLSQRETVEKYADERKIGSGRFRDVPLSPSVKLDEPYDGKTESIYSQVGELRYLADRTRHDLLYATGRLGSHMQEAPPAYVTAAGNLLKYAVDHKDVCLHLGGTDRTVKLFAYADGSYNAGTKNTYIGWCIFLNRTSGAIVAKSKKEDTPASGSSTDAEIKALNACAKDIVWIRGFLSELGYKQTEATVIYQDNSATVQLAKGMVAMNKSQHMLSKLIYVKDLVEHDIIEATKIGTANMVADILTGPREGRDFHHLSEIMQFGHEFKKFATTD